MSRWSCSFRHGLCLRPEISPDYFSSELLVYVNMPFIRSCCEMSFRDIGHCFLTGFFLPVSLLMEDHEQYKQVINRSLKSALKYGQNWRVLVWLWHSVKTARPSFLTCANLRATQRSTKPNATEKFKYRAYLQSTCPVTDPHALAPNVRTRPLFGENAISLDAR